MYLPDLGGEHTALAGCGQYYSSFSSKVLHENFQTTLRNDEYLPWTVPPSYFGNSQSMKD